MDFVNPPLAFVVMDGLVAPRLFRSFYRGYADRIHLAGNEAVLEFGCGSGGISEQLACRLPNGSITCVDISPPMVRIAARRMKKRGNVRCLVGRIESFSLPEASYDVVVVHNALHDILTEERVMTAKTLATLLAPGGRLYFREPTKLSHGFPVDIYRSLMHDVGLHELSLEEAKRFPIGPVVEAVFEKPS